MTAQVTKVPTQIKCQGKGCDQAARYECKYTRFDETEHYCHECLDELDEPTGLQFRRVGAIITPLELVSNV